MTLLTKDTLKNKYQQRPYLVFMRVFFLLIFFIKTCCGYSFELHRQVDAIQMGTHNICLYKEVDKKYTGYNLKTMELLDCALIGVYAVIRSNTVYCSCRCFFGFFFFFLKRAPWKTYCTKWSPSLNKELTYICTVARLSLIVY